jgi:hypothetical protein
MKLQLCMLDEYGSTSIHNSSESFTELIKEAKRRVQGANVDNPLTVSEKKRLWEEAFPILCDAEGDPVEHAIYAGKDPSGRDIAYKVDRDVLQVNLEEVDAKVHYYLGDIDGSPWFLEDEHGTLINNPHHPVLSGKSLWFIRKVR